MKSCLQQGPVRIRKDPALRPFQDGRHEAEQAASSRAQIQQAWAPRQPVRQDAHEVPTSRRGIEALAQRQPVGREPQGWKLCLRRPRPLCAPDLRLGDQGAGKSVLYMSAATFQVPSTFFQTTTYFPWSFTGPVLPSKPSA